MTEAITQLDAQRMLDLQLATLPKDAVYVCSLGLYDDFFSRLRDRRDVCLITADQLSHVTRDLAARGELIIQLGLTLTPRQHVEVLQYERSRHVDPRLTRVHVASYHLVVSRPFGDGGILSYQFKTLAEAAAQLSQFNHSLWTWEIRSSSAPLTRVTYKLLGRTVSGFGERVIECSSLKEAADRLDRELKTGPTYRRWTITSSDYRENRA